MPEHLPKSTEVVLHEVGESVASAVANIQRELACYPNVLGAFLLDEMELDIPIRTRVDSLGQFMVTAVGDDESTPSLVGRLHLKLRPVLGATEPPPVISNQSLEDLKCLKPEEIDRLHQQRIFSIDDLLRVTSRPVGQNGLAQMNLESDLERLKGRAFLLASRVLPKNIVDALFQAEINSIDDFLKRSPEKLAEQLSQLLNQPIPPKVIKELQNKIRQHFSGGNSDPSSVSNPVTPDPRRPNVIRGETKDD